MRFQPRIWLSAQKGAFTLYPTLSWLSFAQNIIPIWAGMDHSFAHPLAFAYARAPAALIAGLVPMFFFLLFAIRHRSFEAFITPTMAVLMSLIVAATFQGKCARCLHRTY